MSTQKTLMTAEDLFRLPDDGNRYELLDGELKEMAPTGGEHGRVMARTALVLESFSSAGNLGDVLVGGPGIFLRHNPDRVRAPDACFFARGRFTGERIPSGYLEVIPDFVAEIVSPGDTAAEVEEKVQEWLAAGVPLVWVLYPATRSIAAYRSLTAIRVYTEAERIDGEPVFPGLSVPVKDFFA